MNKRILFSFLMIALLAGSAAAQVLDTVDLGERDTIALRIEERSDVVLGDSTFRISVYWYHDAQVVSSGAASWKWDHHGVSLDSATWTPLTWNAFRDTSQIYLYYKNDIDSSNFYRRFTFGGFHTSTSPRLPANPAAAEHMGDYFFRVDSLTVTDSIRIDSQKTAGGRFTFTSNPVPATSTPGAQWNVIWPGLLIIQDVSDVIPGNPDALPTTFRLEQNYPNPFNPSTNISFDVPAVSKVNLSVYNVLGQKVTTLVDETMPAGTYEKTWNGTNESGASVASGIYFYRLESNGGVVDTKKMMLVK